MQVSLKHFQTKSFFKSGDVTVGVVARARSWVAALFFLPSNNCWRDLLTRYRVHAGLLVTCHNNQCRLRLFSASVCLYVI